MPHGPNPMVTQAHRTGAAVLHRTGAAHGHAGPKALLGPSAGLSARGVRLARVR
jgi:hypothetical protein